ncbi:MAG: D-glycero-beta-D-manno-heptose-7-phosphate kinase [Rhodospirillales bacterium]|jgi:D-beta-D-heptose 7-phosphate kinase/D-beta-D-heptose 1-phosphate adenosyltransferase|nr:D-glycero-beta-D-manno-heptose-7-phosphate kinase [Rhodospirillales bacterium]
MNDPAALIALAQSLTSAKVLCVGDVVLDHYRHGVVERISPEAPIPVLSVEREDAMLGGAGNVMRNLASLGSQVRCVSVVGEDAPGTEIGRLLRDIGISTRHLIKDGGRRTSTKARYLAAGQQMLRADFETVAPLAPDIRERLLDAAAKAMRGCSVVVLSDYGKGTLADGVAGALITLAREAGKAVIVDPKGNDFDRYRGATLLTPNRRELGEATRMATESEADIVETTRHLLGAVGVDAVLATRGADGMTLATADGQVAHFEARAREVFDVSGAGDTVVAAVAAALGAGAELSRAAALANVAAGIVVGKVGTAAVGAEEVVGALHHQDLEAAEAKVLGRQTALARIDKWRQKGLRIGFTNGCFDLLHPGHVALLAQAKAACDRLVLGLNSDASVSRLKGATRPLQTEAARATVLASLASVDLVIIYPDDTPLPLITDIRPDVLVKGADWALEDVIGAKEVQASGGRVVLVDLEPGHSTTATIARMGK